MSSFEKNPHASGCKQDMSGLLRYIKTKQNILNFRGFNDFTQ